MFISKLTDLKLIISILYCSCMCLIFDTLHYTDIYLFFITDTGSQMFLLLINVRLLKDWPCSYPHGFS